jgi:hypothetical protein
MDAAGPMETQQRFPPVLGKPHNARFSTSVHSHRPFSDERREDEPEFDPGGQHPLDCPRPQRRYAPITMRGPSDHDDVDALIMMHRNN